MEKHFQLFSKGSVSLTKNEALKAIQSIGQDPSKKEYNECLMQVDIKPDQKISLDQFKLVVQLIWNENSLESALESAFRRFDNDKDGKEIISFFLIHIGHFFYGL